MNDSCCASLRLSLLGHEKTRAGSLVFSQESKDRFTSDVMRLKAGPSEVVLLEARSSPIFQNGSAIPQHRKQKPHLRRPKILELSYNGQQFSRGQAQSGILPLPILSIFPNNPLRPPAPLSPLSLPYPVGAGILPILLSPL